MLDARYKRNENNGVHQLWKLDDTSRVLSFNGIDPALPRHVPFMGPSCSFYMSCLVPLMGPALFHGVLMS